MIWQDNMLNYNEKLLILWRALTKGVGKCEKTLSRLGKIFTASRGNLA